MADAGPARSPGRFRDVPLALAGQKRKRSTSVNMAELAETFIDKFPDDPLKFLAVLKCARWRRNPEMRDLENTFVDDATMNHLLLRVDDNSHFCNLIAKMYSDASEMFDFVATELKIRQKGRDKIYKVPVINEMRLKSNPQAKICFYNKSKSYYCAPIQPQKKDSFENLFLIGIMNAHLAIINERNMAKLEIIAGFEEEEYKFKTKVDELYVGSSSEKERQRKVMRFFLGQDLETYPIYPKSEMRSANPILMSPLDQDHCDKALDEFFMMTNDFDSEEFFEHSSNEIDVFVVTNARGKEIDLNLVNVPSLKQSQMMVATPQDSLFML